MNRTEHLGQLRDLLTQPPSPALWWEVIALFHLWEESDELFVGVEYANAHMAGWPDRWRIAPYQWADIILGGEKAYIKRNWKRGQRTHPAMPLVRRIVSYYHEVSEPDERRCLKWSPQALKHWGKAKGLESLTMLEISDSIEDSGALLLSQKWPTLPGLTQLKLQNNKLSPQGIWDLAYAGILDGLVFLDVSQNPLGPEGIRAICETPGLSGIQGLNIDHTQLNKEAFEMIETSEQLARLRWLTLNPYWNEHTSQLAKTLRDAPFSQTLETLVLTYGSISDKTINAIAEGYFPNLHTLNITGNTLGNAGLRCLVESKAFPQLERIHCTIYNPKEQQKELQLMKKILGDKLDTSRVTLEFETSSGSN